MFDNIADNYDFLNHSLSMGMDYYWRRKAVNQLTNNPKHILDVSHYRNLDFAISSKVKFQMLKLQELTFLKE